MIQPVLDFAQEFVTDKSFDKIVEVGSRNVNGSVKPIFKQHCNEYYGLDLIDGDGVDIVDDAINLKKYFKNNSIDCVVCVETLEHVKDPVRIVKNMRDILKRGGWLFITTPGIHHPEHGWPSDYYRFMRNTYSDIFFEGYNNVVFNQKNWEGNDTYPDALFGYGQKP